MTKQHCVNPAFYRYLPFAVFMAFIGLDEAIRFFADRGLLTLETTTLYYLYPLKTLVVAYLLFRYRKEYRELTFKDLANIPATLAVCGVGLLVFFLWIQMDWGLGVTGTPQGFNPTLLPGNELQIVMTLFRVAGAVLVVPLMEELFWRSFMIRYIINIDFQKVSIGTFTWISFLLTVILFGFEHYFILAGIMAGVLYSLVLYRTRSIAQCVLAHAVTNLALALYVIITGKWYFW
ncbi:MAG: CAAX prenyl protease-related protein [Geobacteraceae bacterium]